MNPNALPLALLLGLLGTIELAIPNPIPAQVDETEASDFNGDGTVDVADFGLFLGAFGSGDPVFDLNDNGKVGFDDLFIFSRLYGRSYTPARPPTLEPPPIFPNTRGADSPLEDNLNYNFGTQSAHLVFADYRLTLSYGDPFGISALRLQGQSANFANPAKLPFGTTGIIADWEWFKFQRENEQRQIKLKEPTWQAPAVEFYENRVLARFSRPDVLAAGVELRVEYSFEIEQAAFAVRYTIRNGSAAPLLAPYTMLGFPGFTNFAHAVAVETQVQSRTPNPPHDNFRAEAAAAGLDQYRLLRHDVEPWPGRVQPMRGAVVLEESGRLWTLECTFTDDGNFQRLFSGHYNKPLYMTSHLYSFFNDIPVGAQQSIVINYTLSSQPAP
ncbi:MAG: hypothetical protein GKR89_19445 [Candidatus Latescibacteria bacterium]|nr:hypothetical protein [Candidatus Latescibacterota bacterium]